jgi:hypothetical protein
MIAEIRNIPIEASIVDISDRINTVSLNFSGKRN